MLETHKTAEKRRGASVAPRNDFFLGAIIYTLQNEIGSDWVGGGFTEDPDDSGRATRWGITQKTLEEYRGCPVTAVDVEALTLVEAREIYRELFWERLGLDALTRRPSTPTAVFDMGVLFGVRPIAKASQLARQRSGFGGLTVDGVIGPRTIEALTYVRVERWNAEFRNILHARISNVVQQSPKNEKYMDGWRARVDRLKSLV